jgi:VWFA-related protein
MGTLPLIALLWLQASVAADVEVRTVLVTMLDEAGAPVEGVLPEEVALLENGVARDLTRFELDERPLVLALVLDSSQPIGSAFRMTMVEAVMGFLNRLPAQARYALWTTGDRPTKIVDFTDNPAAALEPLRRVFPRGGNTVLDALVEASRDLKTQEGSRSAVVTVTGVGVGFTNYERRHVVEVASRNAMLFMSVEVIRGIDPFRGSEPYGEVRQQDYEYVLANLAERSGGRLLTTLSAMGIGKKLAEIGAELRGQYRLSYATLPELEERKLEVRVARPELRVRIGASASGGE